MPRLIPSLRDSPAAVPMAVGAPALARCCDSRRWSRGCRSPVQVSDAQQLWGVEQWRPRFDVEMLWDIMV
jgi:hypothetical protein